MREINTQFGTQTSQTLIGCIVKSILVEIIFRIEPFFLQLSLKRFGNIQMRRVGMKKENEQSSFLPIGDTLLNQFRFMYTCIIQYKKCFFVIAKENSSRYSTINWESIFFSVVFHRHWFCLLINPKQLSL